MYLPASGNPNRNTGTRATLATENRLMSMRTLLAHDLGEASSPSSVLDLSLAMSSLSASCVVPVSRPSSMKRMFPLWIKLGPIGSIGFCKCLKCTPVRDLPLHPPSDHLLLPLHEVHLQRDGAGVLKDPYNL